MTCEIVQNGWWVQILETLPPKFKNNNLTKRNNKEKREKREKEREEREEREERGVKELGYRWTWRR